jgi:GH25 family lysozyme M1 (1,4-beta-N-acetylmuramidase)
MPRPSASIRHALPLAGAALLTALLAPLLQPLQPAAAASAPSRPVGIDVSRWQSAGPDDSCAVRGIDWTRVRTTSRSFVFIRATRTHSGVTERDACFTGNWTGAEAHGVYRGAYHYAIPSAKAGSAVRDARTFVAVTGRMQDAGDLPPVLDLETSGGLKPVQLSAWAATWLSTVRTLTGRQPMIYTYPSFWRTAMADSQAFHAYPLWIANWTRTPSVPGGWPTWTVHQYSASGRVAGISGDVDLDVFNGTADQLHAFAHPGTHPTAGTSGRTAFRGSPWRISGHLVTDRGAAIPRATVRLYRSVAGGPWRLIATTKTSGTTAYYRFVLRPRAAASYKVRYSGGTTFAPSWSNVRSHAIRQRSTTTLTVATSATRVRRGAFVRVRGTLLRTVSHARLPGKTVTLDQRVGRGRWTAVRSVRTSATGRYAFGVRPTRGTAYRVRFAGSLANLPSVSAQRTVRLR